jgi:hypothetical protein
MNQPILLLYADDALTTPVSAEILRCEGFPWLDIESAASFVDAPPEVELIVVAGSGMGNETAERLAAAVAGGTTLIALAPDPALLRVFGVTAGAGIADAWLTVRQLPSWEHGSLPLLCPDDISQFLEGGETVAELRDADGVLQGSGIVEVQLGEGKAWLYGYDLCQAVVTFRHGDGDLHERPLRDMGPLKGPRHLYSFFELSEKTTRDVPVADVHQDILRTLVAEALAGSPLPRLWHFPDAAPALWFIKGDGCGEEGAPVLVDTVESYGALLTFYRAPFSRYEGDLMKEWHARGHAVSIEVDLTSITQYAVEENGEQVRYGRTPEDLNENFLPALRANLQESWDVFRRETGLDVETICSHGCQWTGYPLLQTMLDFGWYTPTHFASHDPRMRRGRNYGPYMIGTGLCMPYFQHGEGITEMWHMPAQWDESQTIGRHEDLLAGPMAATPDRVEGMVGLTSEEYGIELARFAESAATRWHVMQIANFHPVYAAGPQDHVRASRHALELGMEGAIAAGCRFENQENYSSFSRARVGVRLTEAYSKNGSEFITLEAGKAIEGLTLLLPDCVLDVRDSGSGAELPIQQVTLESRRQSAVTVDLGTAAPKTLCFKTNG